VVVKDLVEEAKKLEKERSVMLAENVF